MLNAEQGVLSDLGDQGEISEETRRRMQRDLEDSRLGREPEEDPAGPPG